MKAIAAVSLGMAVLVSIGVGRVAAGPKTSRATTDQFSDPLPDGAVMRLGTMRLRHFMVRDTAFAPNGEVIASLTYGGEIALWDRKTGRRIRTFHDSVGDHRTGWTLAFSPDGKKIFSVGSVVNKRLATGCVWLWDAVSGKKIWSGQSSERNAYETAAFSPDGTMVAAGGSPFTVWDVATGKEVRQFDDPSHERGGQHAGKTYRRGSTGPVAFSPDGRLLLTFQGGLDFIRLRDARTGERRGSILLEDKLEILSLCMSANGKQIIAGGYREPLVPEIRYFDVKTEALARKFRFAQPTRGRGTISLSKDQKTIAWNVDDHVWIWDAVAGNPLKQFPLPGGVYGRASLSPDGSAVAVADHGVITLWETASGSRLPAGVADFITSVISAKFSPDGRSIYTGGRRGHLVAWDESTGAVRYQKSHGPESIIRSVDVSADGRWIATGGMKENISHLEYLHVAALWDARTGKRVREFCDRNRRQFIYRVAISPDSRLLAIDGARNGSKRMETDVWDLQTGKKLTEIHASSPTIDLYLQRFSSDSKALYTISTKSEVQRWNATSGALEHEFRAAEATPKSGDGFRIRGAQVAPDDQTIVISEDRSIFTWNLHSGELDSVIESPNRNPHLGFAKLAISRDGRLMAAIELTFSGEVRRSSILGSVIRIFDRLSGRELQSIDSRDIWADAVEFSPDPNRLASVMNDGSVLIWDLSPARGRLSQ